MSGRVIGRLKVKGEDNASLSIPGGEPGYAPGDC